MKELGLFIYTETSLHAGTGSTVSAVDLPIQRERTTRHPLVQGSGVKGAMRMVFEDKVGKKDDTFLATFGYKKDKEDDDADKNKTPEEREEDKKKREYASALSVGDARIVLFPVQSLAGVFAYITCPMVLARMKRDLPSIPAFSQPIPTGEARTTKSSAVAIGTDVILEEFSFSAKPHDDVDKIATWLAENALPQGAEYAYWRDKLVNSLVILSDGDFTEFTVNSTEIVTRIKIDSAKKTVENGALWTQELLPADTLLMSVVSVVDSRKPNFTMKAGEIAEWLRANLESVASRIQLGGDETTGNGFVAVRFVNGEGQ